MNPDKTAALDDDVTLETCQHCGATVPAGTYCGNCGAHLSDDGGRSRVGAYAAVPGEHVAHVSVVTTLFPHLQHRHSHLFRALIGAGLLIVVALAAVRLFTPATIAAAVLLPILYVLYLYEVEVYEHEPVLVMLVTFVAGIALGVGYSLVSGAVVRPQTVVPSGGDLVISGIVMPLAAQLLMVLGPLLLLSRTHFDETLDGLTFGVTTALGFTMAALITSYWQIFTAPLVGAAASTDDVLRIFRAGILAALVNASATGMITASVWLFRHGRSRRRHPNVWRGLPASVILALLAQVVLGVGTYLIPTLVGQVLLWAVAAALLLAWLRVLLHYALLEEGRTHVVGPSSACRQCHRLVPTMQFCPACGVARSVGAKHSQPAALEPGAVS